MEREDNEEVKFFDIKNLSFERPLSLDEINNFKELMFSPNGVSQIYFKDEVGFDSIETVKNIISMSGVDDSKIEKIVTANLSEDDLYGLVFENFENPDTWEVSYDKRDNNFLIESVPKLREFLTYLSRIKLLIEKENLSQLEKVLRVYDIIKLLEFVSDDKKRTLPDIVIGGVANSNDYNMLFSYVLKQIDINSFIGRIKSKEGKETFITLVYIKDDKYGLDGFYLFDPSMDTLPKNVYKDDIRMINYNFFGRKLEDINYSKYGDMLSGVLGILCIQKKDYSVERKESTKDNKLQKEFTTLLNTFDMSYEDIYGKCFNIKDIDISLIMDIIQNVYGEIDTPNYVDAVKNNYRERKDELFSLKPDEEVSIILESAKE